MAPFRIERNLKHHIRFSTSMFTTVLQFNVVNFYILLLINWNGKEAAVRNVYGVPTSTCDEYPKWLRLILTQIPIKVIVNPDIVVIPMTIAFIPLVTSCIAMTHESRKDRH